MKNKKELFRTDVTKNENVRVDGFINLTEDRRNETLTPGAGARLSVSF